MAAIIQLTTADTKLRKEIYFVVSRFTLNKMAACQIQYGHVFMRSMILYTQRARVSDAVLHSNMNTTDVLLMWLGYKQQSRS